MNKHLVETPISEELRASGAGPAFSGVLKNIDIDDIFVPDGRRAIDPLWSEALAQMFKEKGIEDPIDVVTRKSKTKPYQLIAGGHRIAGARLCFMQQVPALIKTPEQYANATDIKLREITENFVRRELSVLDKAFNMAEWRRLYEEARGAIKPGRKSAEENAETVSANFALNFTDAAQKAFGLGRRSVFLALKIAAIDKDVYYQIALSDLAKNQSELLALVEQPVELQGAIAHHIVNGDCAKIAEAVAKETGVSTPAPAAPWKRVSDTFSNLSSQDQNNFFLLHEATIEKWWTARLEANK